MLVTLEKHGRYMFLLFKRMEVSHFELRTSDVIYNKQNWCTVNEVMRKRFSFAIAMDKSTVIKYHDVRGPALIMAKGLGTDQVPFAKFHLEHRNNLITVSILVNIPRSCAKKFNNLAISTQNSNVKLGQSL